MDMAVVKKMAKKSQNSQGVRMSRSCEVFDNTDLLEAILVRVSQDSISKCILVSKHWLGLICSSCFLEHYIGRCSVMVNRLQTRLLSRPLAEVSKLQHQIQRKQLAMMNKLQRQLAANQPHHSPLLAKFDQSLHQLYIERVDAVNQSMHLHCSKRVHAMKQLDHSHDVQQVAVGIQYADFCRITCMLCVEVDQLDIVNEMQQQLQSRLLSVVEESLKLLPSQLLAGVNQMYHQIVSQLFVAVNQAQCEHYRAFIFSRLRKVAENFQHDPLESQNSETGVAPSTPPAEPPELQ